MKALVIGATGATGKDLVHSLLQDSRYTEIVTYVRRASGLSNSKLTEIVTDFDHLEDVSQYIDGDVFFSCLGTTLKAAGSKDKQRHIDYEIPLQFAKIARTNGVTKTVLLSAYGASASSNIFYSKLKGELEDGIADMGFDQYLIFRPGLLLRKNTDRPTENIMAGVLNFFNSLGLFRKFRPLPTAILAEKLAKAPYTFSAGKHIIELSNIFKI